MRLLRVRRDRVENLQDLSDETGKPWHQTSDTVHADDLEYFGVDGNWHTVNSLNESEYVLLQTLQAERIGLNVQAQRLVSQEPLRAYPRQGAITAAFESGTDETLIGRTVNFLFGHQGKTNRIQTAGRN